MMSAILPLLLAAALQGSGPSIERVHMLAAAIELHATLASDMPAAGAIAAATDIAFRYDFAAARAVAAPAPPPPRITCSLASPVFRDFL